MQLSDIQAAIQALGYGTDTAAQQVLFINDTYREVCSSKRWPFLEAQDTSINTTPGVNTYSIAAINPGVSRLDALRLQIPSLQQYINLKYMQPQDLRNLENVDRSPSAPYAWTFINNLIHLYPFPDQVYNLVLDYVVEVNPLVNPTDVPIIPTDYHDVLVWGAIRSIAFRERDWLGRQFAQSEFMDRLNRLTDEYLVRQRQNGSHVGKSGFYQTQLPFPFVQSGT